MNILILTSIFPRNNKNEQKEGITKVVYYFAKEWKKQGHNVKVIHNAHKYPHFVYRIPEKWKEKFKAKFGFPIPGIDIIKELRYTYDGIEVWRLPMLKLIPHGEHPKSVIKAQGRKIQKILEKDKFIPDVIVGHWMSPQAQLINELKPIYHCETALVLHGKTYLNSKKFDFNKYRKNIDKLGCRSITEAEEVKKILNLKKCPFICYSGVPGNYICRWEQVESKFQDIKKWRFLYVGRLVQLKNIDKILMALAVVKNKNYVLDIIGDGECQKELEKLSVKLNIRENVHFHGKLSREETQQYMRRAHCFTMISSGEVFGLVYLEAMAAGCITIGSRGGGIDGVITDSVNGYLCEDGNNKELAKIFQKILELDYIDIVDLVKNALETAENFTDEKVAQKYLKEICNGYIEE
ncbi:MAG: glycosyltransferase family 4 protein [Lachnospiraceae bacterium]|jgi:Glycosyltransferase|nr:glycosyltransferase family 4 protein [Lachnospiraceae bacterium]